VEEFFAKVGVYLLFALVVGILAFAKRSASQWADLKSLPEPAERFRLLQAIRDLRRDGKSHSECLRYLLSQGLRKGVAEGMLIDVETEQAPDLARKKAFHWNGWFCEMPGNWKDVALSESLSRDLAVSIDGVGSASVVLAKVVSAESYGEMLAEQFSRLSAISEAPVDSWGLLKGEGKRARGLLKSHKLPVEISVFAPADVPVPFVVVQVFALEEEELIQPGLKLISSTFRRTPVAQPSTTGLL
jgi:hypothetical protein